MEGVKHRRKSTVVVERSSVFTDVRPEDITHRRLMKETVVHRQRANTFSNLFGSSSRHSTTTRPFHLPPSHPADRTSVAALPRATVQHLSLDLSDRSRSIHWPSNTNSANKCPLAFPPLQRVIKASGGGSTVDSYLVPIVTETREDLPSDIYWLGNPPPQESTAGALEPEAAATGGEGREHEWKPDTLSGTICWLGHPVLNAPRSKKDSCSWSGLRSTPFNALQGRAPPPPCKIREERNVLHSLL